ncbi:MAG: phosphoribosylanthranilate isomerase [Pseudomonadales bacterium]|nr:phosphoribosylanthranilate isomerase [Pseudomonadales bacterium]
MPRIKICGLTRPEDVHAAVDAGADALGFNFHAASPRAVSIEKARELCALLPPFVTSVGLFVDADPRTIEAVLAAVPLQMLQFHGDEAPEQCDRWARPYLKALRMREDLDPAAAAARYPGAAGILLDSYRPGVPGGTGDVFDWGRIPVDPDWPLVLAGGLDAHNVARAIRQVRPWAVDVSGGVEAEKGIKDARKMRAFVQAVHGSFREQVCDEH